MTNEYHEHYSPDGEYMQYQMENPPKEKDTPKEAANELEEELKEILVVFGEAYHPGIRPIDTLAKLVALINKQRQEARVRASLEALQDFKRYMDLTSQHAFEAIYSVLCKRIGDIEYELKELESKEEV